MYVNMCGFVCQISPENNSSRLSVNGARDLHKINPRKMAAAAAAHFLRRGRGNDADGGTEAEMWEGISTVHAQLLLLLRNIYFEFILNRSIVSSVSGLLNIICLQV